MGIDLNSIPDFNYLEPGLHDVKITKLEVATNTHTGNKGYKITVEDRGGASCSFTVWTTKNKGTEKNLIGVKMFLRRSGLLDQLTPAETADFSFDCLKGKRLWAVVKKEEGRDGRSYSVIDPDTGLLTDEAAVAYGRNLTAQQDAPKPAATAPPVRQPAPADTRRESTEGEADDLPF